MKYSKAFSYVFEDSNWISKILIAGLISLIPIVGQIYISGWLVEIVRRVKAGRTDILPATHFSYFLTLGLKMFVVVLIYSLPVSIITSLISVVNRSIDADSSGFVVMIAVSVSCLGSIISILLGVALSMLTSYGTIKLAETDQIRPCLNIREAFYCIRDNFKLFLIVMLFHILISIIAPMGMVACLIGLIFTIPYASAVSGHLIGQLWDNLDEKTDRSSRVRGAAQHTDDIIEEAPFTKVQDIEENLGESYSPTHEEPIVEEPVVDEPVVVEPAEEEPVEESAVTETAAEAAEEQSPVEEAHDVIYGEAPVDEPVQTDEETNGSSEEKTDEDPSSNNDLPSFE